MLLLSVEENMLMHLECYIDQLKLEFSDDSLDPQYQVVLLD